MWTNMFICVGHQWSSSLCPGLRSPEGGKSRRWRDREEQRPCPRAAPPAPQPGQCGTGCQAQGNGDLCLQPPRAINKWQPPSSLEETLPHPGVWATTGPGLLQATASPQWPWTTLAMAPPSSDSSPGTTVFPESYLQHHITGRFSRQ